MRRTLSAGNLQQKPERHSLVAVAPVRRDVVDVILQPLRCLLGGQHALVDDEAKEDAGQVEEADLQIVKSVDAPAASVVAPPVKLAHLPPPLTLTLLSDVVPVLVSVTTMVTVPPTATFDPSAGVELLSVSEVDVVRPVTLPEACSPADGAVAPN